MQRITTLKSAQQAKDYFNKELSKGDYYSRDQAQEVPSRFGGRLADQMGLSGEVSREAFYDLIEHKHPLTGEKLTRRRNEKGNRRPGTDITFSAPKSVSVYFQQTQDVRVLEAFESAVQETMEKDIEPLIAARVRQGGEKRGQRVTGNGLWSTFVHHTARPAKERDPETKRWKQLVPDPHTHAHVILHNVTWDSMYRNRDGTRGAYVAVEAEQIHLARPFTEASFHARLAKKLTDAGLAVRRTDHGFELAGFSAEVKETFSQRTVQIEKVAHERGIRSAELKAKLAQSTRSNKSDLSMDELRTQWDSRLSRRQWDAFLSAARGSTGEGERTISAREALSFGVDHALARQSVATDREILKAAVERGTGSITVDDLRQRLPRHEGLIIREVQGRTLITTREVLRTEQEILNFASDGLGRQQPLGNPGFEISPIMKDGREIAWNPDQLAAIEHILSSRDRVTVLRGAAGVGKTTLLQEATRGIEANGRSVFALAPTAAAADVLKDDGFGNAGTIAKFLQDKQQQADVRDQVILVDEAGLVGTQDMHALFVVAKQQNARVILSGDYKQHSAVARGQPMRQILEQTPVKAAEVTTITRQQNDGYRDAVELLSRGTPEAAGRGFDRLVELGMIRQVDDKERYLELASAYLDATREGPQAAVMISPTHKEIGRANSVLRETLKADKQLDGKRERTITQLKNRQLTDAEKSDPSRYRQGNVVQFFQNTSGGFRAGERAQVVETTSTAVVVEKSGGQRDELPLGRSRHFQVYETSDLAIAPGERIRITQNGMASRPSGDQRPYRVTNNQFLTVKGFTRQGHLELENGRILDRDYGHISWGYSSTSMSAQGRTAKVNIVAQSSTSGRASDMRQFYVSTSRGKHQLIVLTDDVTRLRQAVVRDTKMLTAKELAAQAQPQQQPDRSGAAAVPKGSLTEGEQRKGYFDYVRDGLRRAQAYARQKVEAWKSYHQEGRRRSADPDRGVAYER